MELNQRKELFSKAYVRAVAAVAGCSVDQPEDDYDSIDLRIKARSIQGAVSYPQLDLQLKCTSRDILDANCIRYPLILKNYNDLRINCQIPRILVVVLVPENIAEWLEQSEQQMSIKYCAYWVSLRGFSATGNIRSVTVELPRNNLFSVTAI
ncbi:MAG: DUF4365 domain-containing protein [Microcoleus sp. SU_5_6]|nr:DUF4365 domain-containing protein [Microcoleus sp. SU_5_6]